MAAYATVPHHLERSRSGTHFSFSPPPEPPHRAQTLHVSHISTGSVERDPFAATAQTYYTYSGKEHLIGLQWGDTPASPTSTSETANSASTLVKTMTKGKSVSAKSSLISKSSSMGHGSGGDALHVVDTPPAPPAKDVSLQRIGTTSPAERRDRRPSPSVQATTAQRADDTGSPSRAVDAGPAELPPAYNDHLY